MLRPWEATAVTPAAIQTPTARTPAIAGCTRNGRFCAADLIASPLPRLATTGVQAMEPAREAPLAIVDLETAAAHPLPPPWLSPPAAVNDYVTPVAAPGTAKRQAPITAFFRRPIRHSKRARTDADTAGDHPKQAEDHSKHHTMGWRPDQQKHTVIC